MLARRAFQVAVGFHVTFQATICMRLAGSNVEGPSVSARHQLH